MNLFATVFHHNVTTFLCQSHMLKFVLTKYCCKELCSFRIHFPYREFRCKVRDVKHELIAAQLTHIELDFLNNISCDEMISYLGKDMAADSSCQNVDKYVKWLLTLIYFI